MASATKQVDLKPLFDVLNAPIVVDDPAPPKHGALYVLVGLGAAIVASLMIAYSVKQIGVAERAEKTPKFETLPPGDLGCPATLNYWDGAKWPYSFRSETVAGKCLDGTRGSITRACSATGVWEEDVEGECVPYCPGEDSGNAEWPDTETGERASGTCRVGYEGTPVRDCLTSGKWAAVANGCTENI